MHVNGRSVGRQTAIDGNKESVKGKENEKVGGTTKTVPDEEIVRVKTKSIKI